MTIELTHYSSPKLEGNTVDWMEKVSEEQYHRP